MTTAAEIPQEYWKRDPEFPHIEVSNAGRVRNTSTGLTVPVKGSGGKAFVQLTDHHGRRHDRNLRRLVRKLFGIAPIRLNESVPPTQPTAIEQETSVTTIRDDSWVTLSWPGVKRNYYRISRVGIVKNEDNEALTGTTIRSGLGDYLVMNLLREDQGDYVSPYVQVRLDELVALHFVGPRPEDGYTISHLNGDRMDNNAENLEWIIRPRTTIRRSPFSGPRPKKGGLRVKRAKKLNSDPDWRLVTNPKVFPGQYWVSRDGRARGVQDTDLKEFLREDGRISVYMKTSLTGNATTFPLDELVLAAFGDTRPTPRHRVRHLNGDLLDNRVENLEWHVPGKSTPPAPTPVEPEPVITPTRAQVKVTTLASYRIGDVEVIVNNGIIEPPKGGTAVEQAAALAQIYAEIARQGQQ